MTSKPSYRYNIELTYILEFNIGLEFNLKSKLHQVTQD
jgi:hypothetical protein